jgi:hypothetical protein
VADKKRKTGLGIDAFFSPPVETPAASSGTLASVEPAAVEVSQPPKPKGKAMITTVRVKASAPQKAKPAAAKKAPAQKPATKVKSRSPKRAQPVVQEPEPAVEKTAETTAKLETVKLTIMLSEERFAQLEARKLSERVRRQKAGEKKYRKAVTITSLVDQALAAYLAKPARKGGGG